MRIDSNYRQMLYLLSVLRISEMKWHPALFVFVLGIFSDVQHSYKQALWYHDCQLDTNVIISGFDAICGENEIKIKIHLQRPTFIAQNGMKQTNTFRIISGTASLELLYSRRRCGNTVCQPNLSLSLIICLVTSVSSGSGWQKRPNVSVNVGVT